MQCKQGCRWRMGSATCRVAEPHECPFHTWLCHMSGGRAHRQLRTEVMLPHITRALENCNSFAPRRAAPRRSDAGEAPGFVGSCCTHPSGCWVLWWCCEPACRGPGSSCTAAPGKADGGTKGNFPFQCPRKDITIFLPCVILLAWLCGVKLGLWFGYGSLQACVWLCCSLLRSTKGAEPV